MAKTVNDLWSKWSSDKAAAGMPPTKADVKLRDKHVSESVPYNTKHAVEHIKSNIKQIGKLKVTNKPLANVLAHKSIEAIHSAEEKLDKFIGGKNG